MKCYRCRKETEGKAWEGLHPECFKTWFGSLEEFQDLVALAHETPSKNWIGITSSFFHGKFRKYSANCGKRSYLLKVQQADFPELPAMEYLCNQIAHLLDLLVPPHYFIRLQNDIDTFVCENFMQQYSQANLIHIYRFLDEPMQFSCEGLLAIIEQQSDRIEDINRLVTLTLFDALIGNHDRHGRNIALIQKGKEQWLAPFYDNPSYLALEIPALLGAQHEPRGAIATQETPQPTLRDYVKEWTRLKQKEVILQFQSKLNLEVMEDLIKASFISTKRQKALLDLIYRRYKELTDALQD